MQFKTVARIAFASSLLLLIASVRPAHAQSFVNWENHPLHAVDVSPNGSMLAAVNLPDNRVELFSLATGVPVAVGSVPVGLDPVSVRFRNDGELWVVNHISDSVSVIDVATRLVVTTLQTQDEPYDVVFAGAPQRAFVSCSQSNTVQVFNPVGGTLQATIAINGEDPRALAASADGTAVYVAIFRSSNATTLISGGDRRSLIPNVAGGDAAGPLTGVPVFTDGPYGGTNPPPNTGGPTTATPTVASFVPPIKPEYLPGGANPAPPVALIVRKNAVGQWFDDNGGNWTEFISGASSTETLRVAGWDMPDRDVATINASTLAVTGYARGLMNTVMALAVNPVSGAVTAVGTDGTNEIRFEPNVKGKFTRVNLGIVDPANLANTSVVDLNAGHLNYSTSSVVQSERNKSIGDPRGIVWNAAGTRGYVTGMGSNNLIVIDPSGARLGSVVLGEGALGIALDDGREQLYVLNRFAATISVISLAVPESVVATVALFDPTPTAIKVGRRHMYDTHETSGLGQISCASCHIDGRDDALAWDLGDPNGAMQAVVGTDVTQPIHTPNPGANAHNLFATGSIPFSNYADWHPMKGPMTTQTLQDIIGKEPFHHRGDKDGIEGFAGAYVSLQGDDAPLPPAKMQEFENFLHTITYPPNPFRNFDNSLPTNLPLPGVFSTGRYTLPEGAPLPNGNAVNGLALVTTSSSGATRCVQCHTLPTGMTTHKRWDGSKYVTISPGPNGEAHLALRPDDTTIHRGNKGQSWRNLYEKTGTEFTKPESRTGFGYMNDGREDSIVRRAMATIFDFGSDQNVADFTALLLAYTGFGVDVNPNPDNTGNPPGPASQDTHAAVGKQVTISSTGNVNLFGQTDAITRMIALADATPGRCDLVVKGLVAGSQRGWYYDRITNEFLSDIDGEAIAAPALRALASPVSELTYTVVPRGSGPRIGVDRDEDGYGDRTEVLGGGNPGNPLVTPNKLKMSLALNQQSFSAGKTLKLTASVTPGAAPPNVDAFVMLESPDGTLLYLRSNGTLSPVRRPLASNWNPVAVSGEIVTATITASVPPGRYVWHARVSLPSSPTLVAAASSVAFDVNLE